MYEFIRIAYQAMRQQGIFKRSQYFLLAGLVVSFIIFKQDISKDFDDKFKGKEIAVDTEKQINNHLLNNQPSSSDKVYVDKFPEISGLAKMLIVTIHAPWIFNNQNTENNEGLELESKFSINHIISKFSMPFFKGQSNLAEPEDVPVS